MEDPTASMPTGLFDPALFPFTLALCGVVAIAFFEAASTILGHSLSGLVDDALPDLSADAHFDVGGDLHAEFDADAASADGAFDGSSLGAVLDFLSFGRVPLLVLVILFLLGFGATGFVLQLIAEAISGGPASPGLLSVPAVAGGAVFMRFLGRVIGRIIPKEETAAISRESFVGRLGVVSSGTARTGLPAQIRITDEHGTTHYLLGEPEDDGETFGPGTSVIVVSLEGARARVMRDPTA
ncbi:OB-fold-containig protein [Jiella sonneratiae]|uniref:DUF1449 family protein n=1 Tax=Jiella sonneratiae TaxID=2816856 RepID=A0ABS3J1L3_9HYPH|nr:OB-fold-containig protein [Jiella sonneratiae]MBO0903545.1 DUF1449 family protein [Jiella sonneratiae]